MALKKVLIANRGEIAVRIIRACREEGIKTVAVFSTADADAAHVRAADEARGIGLPAPSESYLRIDRIVDAALSTGADAIHPGYGFLAERAAFAEAVVQAGLTFVGPSAEAIRSMGEKTEARRLMEAAGVPIVPGTTEALPDADAALAAAEDIGFPVMLKAASGGGGKGIRVVSCSGDLASSFEQASSEASRAFGDGSVYIEKVVDRPRHVEIQILADTHGNVIHLGERECSIQRRHQKLIEECPSPVVDARLRRRMGAAAVRAAEAVGYVGAGTVEFLVPPDGEFYFLEMNTRVQVEHPITELVYGVDIVRWQLRIAAGDRLDIDQETVKPVGHAIECRIIAEDPSNNFVPSPGTITRLQIPSGPGVRWDGGVEVGDKVELCYDPLIAKLVVWAEDRDAARHRMLRALGEMVVEGVTTSQSFHRKVMMEESFASGEYDVDYIATKGELLLSGEVDREWAREVAVAAALFKHRQRAEIESNMEPRGTDNWTTLARREGLR